MSIFDHDVERARQITRNKTEKTPPPLPPTTPGSSLGYRMKRPHTRAETASSLVSTGTVLLAFGLVLGMSCLYFIDYSQLSGSPFLIAGAVLGALFTMFGMWLLRDGFVLRRVAHIEPPQIELDEIDLRRGGSYRLAFLQIPSTRLENVTVDLVCDETLIETIETVCPHGESTSHRAHHFRAPDGKLVERSRVPHVSRVHEQRVLEIQKIDATIATFDQIATLVIPEEGEPSGESVDHKAEWKLIVDGSVQDGPSLREEFVLRVRA